MPFIIKKSKHRRGLLAATLAATALIAAPAHAATIANPYNCAPQPTLATSFSTWSDYNLYTPVPNAGVENGATGWTLTGAASVVVRQRALEDRRRLGTATRWTFPPAPPPSRRRCASTRPTRTSGSSPATPGRSPAR